MLIRQPLVIPPDLLDHTVLAGTQRARRIVFEQTPT